MWETTFLLYSDGGHGGSLFLSLSHSFFSHLTTFHGYFLHHTLISFEATLTSHCHAAVNRESSETCHGAQGSTGIWYLRFYSWKALLARVFFLFFPCETKPGGQTMSKHGCCWKHHVNLESSLLSCAAWSPSSTEAYWELSNHFDTT